MPVELRKRKTPPPAPVRPAKKKAPAAKGAKANKSLVEKAQDTVTEAIDAVKPADTSAAAPKGRRAGKKDDKTLQEKAQDAVTDTVQAAKAAVAGQPVKVGDTINLDGFGGSIQTNDEKATSLKELVDQSKSGVVLFTYPKASTPGCTKQVCFFRDSYTPLTASGFDIYGLSADSPKSNTTFKTKQKLQYPLLCDTSRSLITAIGLKSAKGTTARGVFIVDKSGKVLAAEEGGPQATVDVAQKILSKDNSAPAHVQAGADDSADAKKAADTASDVANAAEAAHVD